MEMIIREIEALKLDVKVMLSHADNYHREAEGGLRETHMMQAEKQPKHDQVVNLTCSLINAKHDIDRLRDEMKEVLANLEKLVDTVEYETVAEEIR